MPASDAIGGLEEIRISQRNPHIRASQMHVPSPSLHPAGHILEAVSGWTQKVKLPNSCRHRGQVQTVTPTPNHWAQHTPTPDFMPPCGVYRLTRNSRDASCYKQSVQASGVSSVVQVSKTSL